MRGVPGRIWVSALPPGGTCTRPWPGCAWSVTQAALTWPAAGRMGSFSGSGCGDLAPGDGVTGADETWLHHLGVHPAQPKLPAQARVDKAHGLGAEAAGELRAAQMRGA